jgi:hypothetical protein
MGCRRATESQPRYSTAAVPDTVQGCMLVAWLFYWWRLEAKMMIEENSRAR